MPRKPRTPSAGVAAVIIQRGNNRQAIPVCQCKVNRLLTLLFMGTARKMFRSNMKRLTRR